MEGPVTEEVAREAQRIRGWLDGIDPTARQVIERVFAEDQKVMQTVLGEVLQVDMESLEPVAPGETLTGYIQRLAPAEPGPQLYIPTPPYCDPPLPGLDTSFEVVFDVTNSGGLPSPPSRARVRANVDYEDIVVDVNVPAVEPGATTTVRARLPGGRYGGTYGGTVYVAFDGSEEPSSVPGPAGVVYGYPIEITIGGPEYARAEPERDPVEAVSLSLTYILEAVNFFDRSQVDVSNVAWALQNLGPVLDPDVRAELDSLAAQVEGTNPESVTDVDGVRDAARAAAGKLFEAQRSTVDGASSETFGATLAEATDALRQVASKILGS